MTHLKSPSNILLILFAVFLLARFSAGFTEPSSSPPLGNVPAPLNVSSSGQSKAGGLILNTGGASNGLIVDQGNVGIGTQSPTQKLDVIGYVRGATGLCIGSDCRTGWPASGFSNVQVFNTSGSFTVPTGVTKIMVEAWGGGGGGGGGIFNTGGCNPGKAGSGGGGGGYGRGIVTVTPGTIYNVTVGKGGAGGTGVSCASAPNGEDGETSNFGNLISAAGGTKGLGAIITDQQNSQIPNPGGAGGTSTADFNLTGENGWSGSTYWSNGYVVEGGGRGGSAPNGGKGGLGGQRIMQFITGIAGAAGQLPGGGGGGGNYDIQNGALNTTNGGGGALGRVVIWQ